MERIDFNIWSLFILFGAFHGLYLGIMLLLKKDNTVPNRLFAFIVFVFTIHLIEMATLATGLILYVPHLRMISYPLLFTMGPLLFLYAKSLESPFKWQWKYFLHFVPAITFLAWVFPYFLLSAAAKADTFELNAPNSLVSFDLGSYLMGALFYGYNFTYIFLVRQRLTRLLKKNHQTKNLASRTRWFLKILLAYALFIVSCLIFYLIMAIKGQYPTYYDYIHLISMALMIHVVGYFVINQPVLFNNQLQAPDQKKYEKSTLPQELVARYKKDLEAHMKLEKPYLNEDINLGVLAKAAGISKHHLSYILNQELGQSFYDFINQYRINEAKSLIQEQTGDVVLIDIGYQAGFGNKVSFYRAFKKFEGLSPSEYLNQLNTSSKA